MEVSIRINRDFPNEEEESKCCKCGCGCTIWKILMIPPCSSNLSVLLFSVQFLYGHARMPACVFKVSVSVESSVRNSKITNYRQGIINQTSRQFILHQSHI